MYAYPQAPPQDTRGQKKLDLAISQLKGKNEEAVEHLAALREALGSQSATFENWTARDLYQLIDPDGIAERLKVEAASAHWIHIVELVRNTLIFVPLVMTWLGITIAASSYRSLLDADPTQETRPFLDLWQHGFNGHLPLDLTLSTLAAIDFSVLLAVLLLTVVVQIRGVYVNTRRERAAEALRAQVVDALFVAALELEAKSKQRPANFVHYFTQVATTLMQQISDERDRFNQLAGQRQQELVDLRAIASALTQFTADIRQVIEALKQSSDTLSDTITTLTQTASAISDQQQAIVLVAQGISARLDALLQAEAALARQQDVWGQDTHNGLFALKQSMDGAMTGVKENLLTLKNLAEQTLQTLARAGREAYTLGAQLNSLTGKQQEMTQKLGEAASAQSDLSIQTIDLASKFKEVLATLETGADSLRGIWVDMNRLERRLAGIIGDHTDAANLLSQGAQDISAAAIELKKLLP